MTEVVGEVGGGEEDGNDEELDVAGGGECG